MVKKNKAKKKKFKEPLFIVFLYEDGWDIVQNTDDSPEVFHEYLAKMLWEVGDAVVEKFGRRGVKKNKNDGDSPKITLSN